MSTNKTKQTGTETVIRQLMHLYEQTGDADQALARLRERLGDKHADTLSDLETLASGKEADASALDKDFEQECWAARVARKNGGQALAAFLRMRAGSYQLGGRLREQWAGLTGFAVYAFFIIGYAALTAAIYFIYSAPVMRGLLENLSATPAPETEWALGLGPGTLAVVIGILGLVMLVIATTVFVARSRGTRMKRIHPVIERMPMFGPVVNAYHDLLDARAARVLVASGIGASEAVALAVGRGSERRKAAWRTAADGNGETRAKSGLFPDLAMANRAGTMEQELDHQSDDALVRFEKKLDRARQLFAPLFYVILGLTVAMLVIGIYLPIFKLGAIV